MNPNKIFENTEIAFALKSKKELKKTHFLFKMMANPLLVKVGSSIAKTSLKLGLPVKGLIKKTIFGQFCGGETEQACLPVINRLYKTGVSSIMDFSVEGKESEADFDAAAKKKLELVAFAKANKEIPIVAMKPTALGRFALWQKVTEKQALTTEEEKEWQRIVDRFDAICKATYDAKLRVLIDAEESWMQDAADDLVALMMERYNKDRLTVYNTLQCYRWDRLDYLKKIHQQAKDKGFMCGMKIVRGAYMEKERERAEEMDYPSPIQINKKATDDAYDTGIRFCLDNYEEIGFCNATHNQESVRLMAELIQERKIPKSHPHVNFCHG